MRFRIMTDGNKFVVEKKGWIFWRECFGVYHGCVDGMPLLGTKYFDTTDEAQEAIKKHIAETKETEERNFVKVSEVVV